MQVVVSPVVAIDDVEDDEDRRVDETEGGQARHRDEQRQRSPVRVIISVIQSGRPVARHRKLHHHCS